MTARERAEALAGQLGLESCCDCCPSHEDVIEEAIEAAEAAAYERIAAAFDRYDADDPNEWFSPYAVARHVRSLATQGEGK